MYCVMETLDISIINDIIRTSLPQSKTPNICRLRKDERLGGTRQDIRARLE